MAHSEIDANALLDKYGTEIPESQRMRDSVHLLCLGLSETEATTLVTVIKQLGVAPRYRIISSESELIQALTEHSWELFLCSEDRLSFTTKQALKVLQKMDRDIPTFQLLPDPTHQQILQSYRAGIKVVLNREHKELLLIHTSRELEELKEHRHITQLENALTQAQNKALQWAQDARQPFLLTIENRIVFINDSLLELLGYEDSSELQDKHITRIVPEDQQSDMQASVKAFQSGDSTEFSFESKLQRTDGSKFSTIIELEHSLLTGATCLQLTFNCESHNRSDHQFEQEIDFISGLYNQYYLDKELQHLIYRAHTGDLSASLLYIQIDQYHLIRKLHGKDLCNQLVRDCADTLRKNINRVHLLSHPYDDAFVVIFFDADLDNALQLGNKVRHQISQLRPRLGEVKCQTDCSIGICSINENTQQPELLLEHAQKLAEQLNRTSKGGVEVSSLDSEKKANEEQENQLICQQLEKALDENQFKLLYQPIVTLSSPKHYHQHYEVLLRLISEKNEEISPNNFLPAINQEKLNIQIDRWVIFNSLKQLRKIPQSPSHKAQNRLFISISGDTLNNSSTFKWLGAALCRLKIQGNRLIIQVSERDLPRDIKYLDEFVDNLHKMNCGFCIKHFGNSAGALDIALSIPVDFVKLDGALVQKIGDDKEVNRLIKLLTAADKKVIAPLVEDTHRMSKLWKSGVDYVQGYYLQSPREKMDYDFFEN